MVAAIGAQRRAVHKLIPLPALFYLVTSTVAGAANDWTNLKDSKELVTSFLTWIGGGFFGLVVATVLVVLITFIRWLGSRLLVSGQFPDAPSGPGRTVPGPASRPRRDSAALGDRAARTARPAETRSGTAAGRAVPQAPGLTAPRAPIMAPGTRISWTRSRPATPAPGMLPPVRVPPGMVPPGGFPPGWCPQRYCPPPAADGHRSSRYLVTAVDGGPRGL